MENGEKYIVTEHHEAEKKEKIKILLLKVGLGLAIAGGASYGIYKLYENHKKTEAEKKVLSSPEVAQAMALYSAMNPSGVAWMKSFDGTNTAMVFQTASEITDLEAVKTEYDNLYHSDLLDDLRAELSPEDNTKFLNTLKYNPNTVENKGGSGKSGKGSKIGLGKAIIVSTAKANLRKAPKDISHWSLHSNIIKNADKGMFLGGSTGKTAFDNNGASDTGTLYLEIKSVAMDTKKAIFFWVAASQVKAISKAEYDSTSPPLLQLKEKETLSGIEDLQNQVIAHYAAPIMDDKFQLVALAKPMQTLGCEIMRLNTGKGTEYVKFLSPQQKEYWVNKKYIQII